MHCLVDEELIGWLHPEASGQQTQYPDGNRWQVVSLRDP